MLKAAEQELPRRFRILLLGRDKCSRYECVSLRIDDVAEVIEIDNGSVAKGHNVEIIAD